MSPDATHPPSTPEVRALVARAFQLADARYAGLDIPGYVLLDELGRGGQATVYRACRVGESDARFAVKVLLPDASPDAAREHLARLYREADLLRRLDHPRILKPHDVGQTALGQPYLVMDFVDGHVFCPETLAVLPLDHRVALLLTVARTLAAAHAQGVVHRDLKPSNIIIARDGAPVLLDFGMAADTDPDVVRQTLTATGRFVGTCFWAAPEQLISSARITPAADVYALGVLLHQLATGGRFPPQVFATLRRLVEPADPDPQAASDRSGRRNDTALLVTEPALLPILRRCLAHDPADRYPTAAELADDLDRYLHTPGHRHARPGPSRRTLLGAGIAAAAALAAVPLTLRTSPFRSFTPTRRRLNGRLVRTLIGNSLEMVFIPPGTSVIGSPRNENGRVPDETEQTVTFGRGFYMSMHEISQSTYELIMGTNPARFVHPAHPVERVSWYDANKFCQRLAQQCGLPVRLPTELEWEYACRAGTRTAFHFGNDPSLLLRYGNSGDLSNTIDDLPSRAAFNDGYPRTAPVGAFIGNAWHLLDMHGNVWEWTASVYQLDPLAPAPDPATVAPDLLRYTARGGSWWDVFTALRCANRNPLPPDTRTSTLGFRIALDDVFAE
ncbi:MAG: bifunctional serine/threonine-protein kinase/formylglycine-generating enzyme family protein [Tepidisphaerales bacterium]